MSQKSKETYPSVRVFQNPVLESLTHVHPLTPLLVWTPVISYLIYDSLTAKQMSGQQLALWALIAFVVWSLTEYVLHRYLFHFPAKSKTGKYLVYLFHGLHHEDPNDPTRLVFPPVPAFFIFCLLYLFFALFVPAQFLHAFMAFFMIGYLAYDYIHYATHHFPMTSTVGRYLKKHHLQHHFKKEHARYGVSSPLWDLLFFSMTGPKKDD